MLVHSPMGRLLEIERWLAGHGPTRMQSGGGLDPHVLRAEFAVVPPSWDELLEGATTRALHLSTAGIATLFLGPGERFTVPRSLDVEDADAPLPRTGAGQHAEGLTDRQIDALSLAVSLGYYEVPHRVSQRELARHLDMSLSGLSRLLRRAEATVIAIHMDAIVDADAHEERFRTLLDAEESPQDLATLHMRFKEAGTTPRTRVG